MILTLITFLVALWARKLKTVILVATVPALLLCVIYLMADYAYGIPSLLLTIPLCLIVGPATFAYRKRKRPQKAVAQSEGQ